MKTFKVTVELTVEAEEEAFAMSYVTHVIDEGYPVHDYVTDWDFVSVTETATSED